MNLSNTPPFCGMNVQCERKIVHRQVAINLSDVTTIVVIKHFALSLIYFFVFFFCFCCSTKIQLPSQQAV